MKGGWALVCVCVCERERECSLLIYLWQEHLNAIGLNCYGGKIVCCCCCSRRNERMNANISDYLLYCTGWLAASDFPSRTIYSTFRSHLLCKKYFDMPSWALSLSLSSSSSSSVVFIYLLFFLPFQEGDSRGKCPPRESCETWGQ